MKLQSYRVIERRSSSDLTARPTRNGSASQLVLVLGLCLLLIFGILAFGAVYKWSILIFEAGSVALFLIWVGRQLFSKEQQLSKNSLYLPALLFFGLVLAQIVLGGSAYAYVTKYEALLYVSYGIVLLIAVECVGDEDSRRLFATVMMSFGALYAFFAVVQELTPNGKIFWVYSPHSHGSIYGSYVNHDHYAGLMEMLVTIPLVLSMGHLFTGGKRLLVGFCAVFMASTIFFSGSRGGMIAFVLEIVLFAALNVTQRKRPGVAVGLVTLCALVLAFLVFVGKGHVLGRLADLGPGIRLNMTKDCLRMFLQRPVWGWGLETFPTVYPMYRSFNTDLFVNEAHNDYAQLLMETGLLGFVLMLWFVVALYRHGLPTSRRWEFRWDGALSLAALLGCTGILFHSFVDFNLHIPANAALFYVLCGLAATELSSWSPRPRCTRTEAVEETVELSGEGN